MSSEPPLDEQAHTVAMPSPTLQLFPAPFDSSQNPIINVAVPGSKSYTIRALLLAAMTAGPVTLLNPLVSDDTLAMLDCLDTLGIAARHEADRIEVTGSIADVRDGAYTLNANLSAATLRFLLALATVLPGVQTLQGHDGLNKRPVRDLVDSLRALGATITYLDRDGYPPVAVSSSVLNAHVARVSGETSSQYLSALMMLAPAVDGLRLDVTGELISRPYLTMTMDIMKAFGVTVDTPHDDTFIVSAGQQYTASSYTIEGDASAACYPVAAAALTGTSVRLHNLPAESLQADMRFLDILVGMGNRIERTTNGLVFTGGEIHPLTVDMRDCPDQAQTLAVILAFAQGKSRLEGLRSLRVKETDRLSATARELTKMGIRVEEEAEALVIHGGNPQPATIETYGDHRMAMAFAVAGTRLANLRILDSAVVNKTYPTFWQVCPDWGIGVQTERNEAHSKKKAGNGATSSNRKIVLIGFMGAGKSHLAALLAQKTGLDCVETDDLIVTRSGQSSIRAIFDTEGETGFRELELDVARSLRHKQSAVISTGGGIVMNKLAIDYLGEGGTLIFLDATLETLLGRLGNDSNRPLLQETERTAALYRLREPLYRHYASIHIVTDGKTPAAVVDEILSALDWPATQSQGLLAVAGHCAG
jgi:3-phosphoshikimate 1-carboxyvinyltransferase